MAELNATPDKVVKKVRSRKGNLRVDLTAMVDLAFLLITFFIMTTTLAKPKIMNVGMPVGDDQEPVAQSRTMTICLGKDNKAMYYLGTAEHPLIAATLTNYSSNGLRRAIADTRRYVKQTTGKNMIVIIKPGNTSVYGNLVNTLDEMAISNIQQYAIVDVATKDIDLMKNKQIY